MVRISKEATDAHRFEVLLFKGDGDGALRQLAQIVRKRQIAISEEAVADFANVAAKVRANSAKSRSH